LNFTADTIDINPLDKIMFNEKQYIVMQAEKDLLEGSSKLELREMISL